MSFDEAIEWLYRTEATGIKLGLENTRKLLAACGNPEQELRFIHVAGTNGKGSVCAMLESMLRAAGYRTGLYTSPHLVDFNERIRVNGKNIVREDVAKGLGRLRKITQTWEHAPTFFELTTVLGIDHFARVGCEIVILETGMGGRLDSTNVVTPLVSVITPISMDHSEWLGDTLALIAAEKAGIIKPGIKVVSAPQEADVVDVLDRRAGECGAQLQFVRAPWQGDVGLVGSHQRWNAALAIAALEASGLICPQEAILNGLKNVEWPARFQRLSEHIIVDGAHNEQSVEALVKTWRDVFGNKKATVIFGALRDKNHAAMLRSLEQIAEQFFLVPVKSPRSEDPQKIATQLNVCHREFDSLPSAIKATDTPLTSPVLITGSLFLAGETLDLEIFRKKN